MPESWNPDQYLRFRAEREQPFRDLVSLERRKPGMRVCDLGCGTGALTAELHRELGARETVGVDLSPAMLAKAPQAEGLRFVQADVEEFLEERALPGTGGGRRPEHADDGRFDLVFSNAALHWVPDHGSLLERLTAVLAPGGQLAFQVPSNDAHPSHETAYEIAAEHRFKRHLSGPVQRATLNLFATDGSAGTGSRTTGFVTTVAREPGQREWRSPRAAGLPDRARRAVGPWPWG